DDHPFGSKRICVDSNYFETFNRKNVSLVDLRETPITKIMPHSIMTRNAEWELDVIIFAIGFDAMTGALSRIKISNVDGKLLKDKWSDGPQTFLGLATAGFPNLFFITGPGSPSVLSNMLVSIEQHVEWITSCLTFMREKNFELIDVVLEAETNWVAHVNELASKTLFVGVASWFNGANISGKRHVFMPYLGGVGGYRRICDDVVSKNYEGFTLQSAR
ncbi:MAG: cyclohexanone monooxygenase, partial [Actinobacteria bacterium]